MAGQESVGASAQYWPLPGPEVHHSLLEVIPFWDQLRSTARVAFVATWREMAAWRSEEGLPLEIAEGLKEVLLNPFELYGATPDVASDAFSHYVVTILAAVGLGLEADAGGE
jgi:hypothetical protein